MVFSGRGERNFQRNSTYQPQVLLIDDDEADHDHDGDERNEKSGGCWRKTDRYPRTDDLQLEGDSDDDDDEYQSLDDKN